MSLRQQEDREVNSSLLSSEYLSMFLEHSAYIKLTSIKGGLALISRKVLETCETKEQDFFGRMVLSFLGQHD